MSEEKNVFQQLINLDTDQLISLLDRAWEHLDQHMEKLTQAPTPPPPEETEFDFIVPEFPEESPPEEKTSPTSEKISPSENLTIDQDRAILRKVSRDSISVLQKHPIQKVLIPISELTSLIDLVISADLLSQTLVKIKNDPFQFSTIIELFENQGINGNELAEFNAQQLYSLLGLIAESPPLASPPREPKPLPKISLSQPPEQGAWDNEETTLKVEPVSSPSPPLPPSHPSPSTSPSTTTVSQIELDYLFTDPSHYQVTPDLFQTDSPSSFSSISLTSQEKAIVLYGPEEYPSDRIDEKELQLLWDQWLNPKVDQSPPLLSNHSSQPAVSPPPLESAPSDPTIDQSEIDALLNNTPGSIPSIDKESHSSNPISQDDIDNLFAQSS